MNGKIGTVALCIIAVCALIGTGSYTWNSYQQRKRDASLGLDSETVARIDKAKSDEPRESEDRMKALEDVSQIGKAMFAYCNDYDDVLPPKTSFKAVLKRYVKPDVNLNRFVYELDGVRASSIPNANSTEAGYISFENKRAVVYVDSHAAWVTSPSMPSSP